MGALRNGACRSSSGIEGGLRSLRPWVGLWCGHLCTTYLPRLPTNFLSSYPMIHQ